MIPLTLSEVARVAGGRVFPDTPDAAATIVTATVVTDSRAVEPGSLYVARRGEHADGFDYVGDAADRGAVAALTNRPSDALPCVVVDEAPDRDGMTPARPDKPPYDAVTRAFAAVAREVHDRCAAAGGLRVVGITGSSGKTSTKDVMAQVLAELGPTVAPEASYNSEVGVPLTVCRLTEETSYLVAEMGASGRGHIEHLTGIAPPQVAVVLNVGTAHLGEFGSREAIAEAKSELVQALPPDGLAVLNADDPVVADMASRTEARTILVGRGDDAEVRATDVVLDADSRASFTIHAPDGPAEGVRVSLRLVGEHHVGNALAVAATAHEWGMPWVDVADALGSATARSRWRMEVSRRPDGVTVVNDAYNANPDSMGAALRALAAMRRPEGRTVAVLGGMLELGDASDDEHAGIGRLAAELGIDHLVAVGALCRPTATAYVQSGGARVTEVADPGEARELLDDLLAPGDVVLLKSSRDSGLRFLGEALAAGSGATGRLRPATSTSEETA